jgi:cytochrome c oxidase assembly factor CtaG
VSWWGQLWSLETVTVLVLALAAVVYARGWARLRRRMPHRFRGLQLLAFLAGLDALLVAVASPLEARAAESLAAHMTQHVILMMVSPPLLWLGAPMAPILRGLPEVAMRMAIGVLAWAPVRRGGRVITHPAVGLLSFTVVAWAWHVPALYEVALRSHAWHHVEHICFLTTALLFWWPVVQPWPSRPRWPRWTMIPYLLLAEVQNTLLAAVFTFVGRAMYPTYAATAARTGASALDDQVAAGLIMWGGGSLALLLPAAWVALELLAPARSRQSARPAHPRPIPPPAL